MAKIKKYVGGLASAASGAGAAAMSNLTGGPASGGFSFGTKLDKFGAPILAATSTIANLINANKKQDPTGRPYKNGTSMVKTKKNKLIKYQNAVDSLELNSPPTKNPDTGTETLFVGYAPPDLEKAKQKIIKEGEEKKGETASGSTGNKNGYNASQTLRATGGAAVGKALGNYRSKSKKLENTINALGGALKYGLPLVSVGYNVNQAMPEEEGGSFDWSKFGGQTAADLFGIMAGRKTTRAVLSPIRRKVEQMAEYNKKIDAAKKLQSKKLKEWENDVETAKKENLEVPKKPKINYSKIEKPKDLGTLYGESFKRELKSNYFGNLFGDLNKGNMLSTYNEYRKNRKFAESKSRTKTTKKKTTEVPENKPASEVTPTPEITPTGKFANPPGPVSGFFSLYGEARPQSYSYPLSYGPFFPRTANPPVNLKTQVKSFGLKEPGFIERMRNKYKNAEFFASLKRAQEKFKKSNK